MKQYVLVVEPISTGMNYLTDIVRLGYTPLALFPYLEVTAETAAFVDEARKAYAGSFPAETLVLYAPASYDELLAQLKQYDIVCAVVGHETGAEVGDRLAADLGLPGNPPASSRRHRDKDAMQQALKDHGLRHIRGKIIHSAAEAEAFIDEEGLGKTVVKHIDGMSSTGLHICDTRAQALAAVQLELGKTNGFGKETGAVLLQEFIAGTEYVVNTVSCNGKHCITDVWRYRKVAVGSDGNPYDHAMLLTRLEPEHVEMCRYALQAVDALDINYGPTHGEYMLTETGPVLIEAGSRPMGANCSIGFLDSLLGHHITDISLYSYIAPEKFAAFQAKKYRPLAAGMFKMIMVPETMDFVSMPIESICRQLPSVYSVDLDRIRSCGQVTRTVDLDTHGGMVYLVNRSEAGLLRDYGIIHQMETRCFGLLYAADGQPAAADPPAGGEVPLAQLAPAAGPAVVYSDSPLAGLPEGMVQCTPSTVAGLQGEYGQAVIVLQKPPAQLEAWFDGLAALMGHLEDGAMMTVPRTACGYFPYGTLGMSMVLKICGCRLELPVWNQLDCLQGTRENG